MPHHLDLYIDTRSPAHGLHPGAKLIALSGFVIAAMLLPTPPGWSAALLGAMLVLAAAAARIPAVRMAKRLSALAFVIGVPFLLSQFGGEATRLAGQAFAVKSLLVAGAFVVLLASTRAVTVLETMGSVPVVSALVPLSEFILRGVDLLVEEVTRTHRAVTLRAGAAGLGIRLSALMYSSISLLGRAAARSDRVAAAMVLRGFRGQLPRGRPHPLPASHLAVGLLLALTALAAAGVDRWL